MSKELGLLTKVVGMDEQALTEKLSTPEGEKEISDKIAGMKIFPTNDEYISHMNNYKDSIKDSLYNDHKASVLEMTEKKILEKNQLQWKRGTDFNTLDELVDKIAEEKVKLAKAGGGDTNKEIEKLEAKIQELIATHKQEKEGILKDYSSKLINKEVDATLFGIKPLLDEPTELLDDKLNFIKYKFNQEYSIREVDGINKVFKGEELARDKNYKEIPLDVVMMGIASKVSKLKGSPAAGRGGNSNTGTNNPDSFDYSSFKTWEDLKESHTELRKLTTGHPLLNKYYEGWKKYQESKG